MKANRSFEMSGDNQGHGVTSRKIRILHYTSAKPSRTLFSVTKNGNSKSLRSEVWAILRKKICWKTKFYQVLTSNQNDYNNQRFIKDTKIHNLKASTVKEKYVLISHCSKVPPSPPTRFLIQLQ